MKKAFTFIAASALILCSAGCQKQDLQQNEFGGQTLNLTLEATRGDAPDTKTTISYNDEYASLESVWETGDKIYVYSRRSGNKVGELTLVPGTIVNQKTSATAQYATSYAKFTGSVAITAPDLLTDDYAFVYQGERSELTPTDGKLSYTISTVSTVPGLNAWDLAYATGKIQGTADLTNASCAVSFTNKLAFGYFTTAGLEETGLSAQYFSGFTFDVRSGIVTGTRGAVTLPDQQAFYMPQIPGEVNMDCGKTWSQDAQQDNKWGYTTTKQSKSFTAAAGSYYRLGRSSDFGPVAFTKTDWTLYETLKDSKFKVAANKEVYFTQGNLQYIGSTATPYWRVAIDQYSYLGANQGCPPSVDAGSEIPANTDVDLFGWGEVTPPFKGSTVNSDYNPTLNGTELAEDWATKFNIASPTPLYADATQLYPKNGTGDYCCLTKEEWTYLFDNQWWGLATVNMNDGTTVNGLVVVPNAGNTDDEIKAHAQTFLTGTIYKSAGNVSPVSYSDNTITQNTIDNNGLLFFPASGYRSGKNVGGINAHIECWTTTSSDAEKAIRILCKPISFNTFETNVSSNRYGGGTVRLAIIVQE